MHDFSAWSAAAVKSWVKTHSDEILLDMDPVRMALEADARKSVREQGELLLRKMEKQQRERARIEGLLEHDQVYGNAVCGVDEVGRGPLAGPIVAAAVILPKNHQDLKWLDGVNDSKKLTKQKREALAKNIRQHALAFAIAEHSHQDIDERGIAWCNHAVFREAVYALSMEPDVVLSDGYPIRGYSGKNIAIVKGDAKSAAIACASILAKVYRDHLMEKAHENYPEYGFDSNVGYGSEGHIAALKRIGPSPLHRRSFLQNILRKPQE